MITPKTKGADAIIDAWLIEGVHPPTHQKLKKQLRREWPMLAKAIERLVNAEDSPENASANENREWALKAEKERDEARGQRDRLAEALREVREMCLDKTIELHPDHDLKGTIDECIDISNDALQSLTLNEKP